MKTIITLALTAGLAWSSYALDKAELDQRVHTLTAKLEAMQQKPDKAIPADKLKNARGIVLLDRTKAGFLFAYQGGSGTALVRDPHTDRWGPIAFVSANEASLGFQIGGQQSFVVILLMTTNATRLLTEPTFEFGGEASGVAGTTGASVEGKVTAPENPVLIYDDKSGLYGGAAIKGGALAPDDGANRIYYEQAITMQGILFERKVQPTESATKLARALNNLALPKQARR